ncbi:MAG: MBL fold metallo-hydrolase [Eggerthellaceae bacterium]|nr:MBL fold metallo-hydrolase [Eggerthellaceae bacterium]
MVDFEGFAREHIRVNAHSSVRIEAAAVNGAARVVYVDPFLMDAEHGVAKAPHDADIICFTHSHYDHFSPKDATAAARGDGATRYVMPASMVDEAVGAGIPKDAITAVEPGLTCYVLGLPLHAVAAYNPAKPFHPKKNLWVGYLIQAQPAVSVYVCGDTDATPEVAGTACDIICIPVGAKYTMDAAEAAACVNGMFAKMSRPCVAIPTHYGSVVGKAEDGPAFEALVDEDIVVIRPY